jgi:hypothetical protein
MIVIHPEWESNFSCVYGYMGVEELKSRKLYEPFIQKIMLNINGLCGLCGQLASIAYYSPGAFKKDHLDFGNYPDF